MGTCHVSSAIKPGRKLILIVGLVWGMAGWALLAPVAVADPFTTTFHLGTINAADLSATFFHGPFNYGFSPLGFDPSVIGQVTIDKISVSTDAVVNGTLTRSTSFDWELFVGPSPFGFTPGPVNGTFVAPQTITSSAPTQFRFAQVGVTETLTGSYDFTTNAFVTNTGNFLKFPTSCAVPCPGASPGDFTGGLYAQAFMWTEAGANLTFNNITMTVSGNTVSGNVVPEPASILLLAAGVLSIVFVLRKH